MENQKCKNTSYMFYGCSSLFKIPDLDDDSNITSNNSNSSFFSKSFNNSSFSYRSNKSINNIEKSVSENFNIFEKKEDVELNDYYENFYH